MSEVKFTLKDLGSSFLSSIDIYGKPVELRVNGKGTHTSKMGGIMTLITIGLFTSVLSVKINDMVPKDIKGRKL
jgi:hypothetical protein